MEIFINGLYGVATLIILCEVVWDRARGRGLYTPRDSFQSLYLMWGFWALFTLTKIAAQRLENSLALPPQSVDMSRVFPWVALTVAYDFIYYWIHRVEHFWSLAWKSSHIHHHSSRYMTFLTGFRSSIWQPLYSLPFLLPLYAMGFRTPEIFATVILNKLYNFWVHQQHVGKISWMDGWLNTPSNHRVHHGRNPQYIDKNFGGIFIIWDKLFGTYEKEEENVSFGVSIDPEPFSPREVFAMGFKRVDASPATPALRKPQT
jgi:alkylglycerol monooxygenase